MEYVRWKLYSFNNIQAAGGIAFFARLRNAAHSAQPCVSQARRHFFLASKRSSAAIMRVIYRAAAISLLINRECMQMQRVCTLRANVSCPRSAGDA